MVFVVFLLTLSVGYGALSTELNIGGDLVVKVERKAQIYEVNEVESFNGVTKSISFEDNKVFGNVSFEDEVSSDVTYQVRFRNNTDKDVILNDIISNTSINVDYEFIDVGKGTIVEAGDSVSFMIKLSLNSGIVSTESFEFVLEFSEYVG